DWRDQGTSVQRQTSFGENRSRQEVVGCGAGAARANGIWRTGGEHAEGWGHCQRHGLSEQTNQRRVSGGDDHGRNANDGTTLTEGLLSGARGPKCLAQSAVRGNCE